MNPKLKSILTGIMIAGDAFFSLVALVLLLDGDVLLGLGMLLFLMIDTALSIDYIKIQKNHAKQLEELRRENAIARYSHIRKQQEEETANPLEENEPDEIAELLNQRDQSETLRHY
ncbi:MAG: hypothetical protein IJJ44_04885 [Solobacterium sp.]|nr:hypothetical protein [Solobacterium sp.]